MYSKLASSLAALFLAVAVTAVPAFKGTGRQSQVEFKRSTIEPVWETWPEITDTYTVIPSPDPVEPATTAMETPSMPDTTYEESMTSPELGFMFAYNIGGKGIGELMDDPEEWVVGETATFEIPDAAIEGASKEYADIYKSHRYGLVGSMWGYDIVVDIPGVYDCTLHYSETYSENFTAEPNRTFKVEISGDASEDVHEAEFDVMVELEGAEFTPYTRTFEGISIMNMLKIRETPVTGDAFLSGISCAYKSPLDMA